MTAILPSVDSGGCLEAIRAGTRHFLASQPGLEEFRLISVVNILRGDPLSSGAAVWELRFKPKRLFPDSPGGEIGAGGEWSVRVDLAQPDAPIAARRDD